MTCASETLEPEKLSVPVKDEGDCGTLPLPTPANQCMVTVWQSGRPPGHEAMVVWGREEMTPLAASAPCWAQSSTVNEAHDSLHWGPPYPFPS